MANPLVLTFGLLGNLLSLAVFLAPLPTFHRVWKRKSTEGFESIPYVVVLFSAMLWTYYAFLKGDALPLLTTNSVGSLIEMVYVALYIAFAPKQARVSTLRLVVLLNFGGFWSIVLLSTLLAKGSTRMALLGWLCAAFAAGVFLAPFSVVRTVIRTKSTEFMPISLSFALTLNAVMWLLYGVTVKDLHIALPNIVGLICGVIQMVVYAIFRNRKTNVIDPEQPMTEIEPPSPCSPDSPAGKAEHQDTDLSLDPPSNNLKMEESDQKTAEITPA